MSSNDQQYPHGPGQGHGYGPGPGTGYDGLPSGPEAQPYAQPQQQPSYPSYPSQPQEPYAYGTGAPGAQPHTPQAYAPEAHAPQAPAPGAHEPQSYGGLPYGNQPYAGEPYTPQPTGGPSHPGQSYGEQSYGSHGSHGSYGEQPYGDQSYGTPVQGSYAAGASGQGPVPGAQAGGVWPTGAGQVPAEAAPPAAHGPQDPGAAQTWEGQTWDTQYQPTIRRDQPAGSGAPSAASVPDAAETAYLPRHAQSQLRGATGSHPLPPEVPAAPAVPAGQAPGAAPADGAPAPASDTGYGAPTTMGNSRVTDAQRARAEGRSPIIPPGIQPAGITAALGLLLALGAAIGSYALFVPLVLLQAVTAAGWFRLNGMWPARQGIALAFAGGLVADIALLAAGRENGPAAILGTLGVWVLLTVVLQLRSQADPDERMYGLMATVVSAALSVLAAGHLAAVPDAVTVGAVAVAAAVLVRALPLPGPVSVAAALLVGAGAGAAAGVLTGFGGAHGALLGLAAGGCALIGLRAASYDYPSRFVHMTAGVALPLTAAAPAVWLIGRLFA